MYANQEYSERIMTGAGGYEETPYGAALQPQPEPEFEPVSDAEPASEPVDAGLLMSFLTDFRTAEYEEVRRKRMEELEKTKKGRARRQVPQTDEPLPPAEEMEHDVQQGNASFGEAYEETHADPQYAQPQVGDPPAAPPDRSYPLNDADFQVAACQQEEPRGKKRFPLGLPSFKSFGQSPATA